MSFWVRYFFPHIYCEIKDSDLPHASEKAFCDLITEGTELNTIFMKELRLGAIETHVADARTCCLHPASATHRQMNDEELLAAGVSADLVRYSTGIENKDDLIADIAAALDKV